MAQFIPRFTEEITQSPTHHWLLWRENVANTQSELARDLAIAIMAHACQANPLRFLAWEAKAFQGTAHGNPQSTVITAVVQAMVGLPTKAKPDDQLQGFIAEYLWYVLTLDSPEPDMFRIHGPSLSVTEQGGDVLVVFDDGTQLRFRLWEIKKHLGSQLSGTVRRAYVQLATNGARYLAQQAASGALDVDPRIAAFYGALAESWVDGSIGAGAGVSVALSSAAKRPRAFSTFGKYFPTLADGTRLRGTLVTIADFPAFCNEVRRLLWSGL